MFLSMVIHFHSSFKIFKKGNAVRYNLHTVKCTHFEYTVQALTNVGTLSAVKGRAFSSPPQKWPPVPLQSSWPGPGHHCPTCSLASSIQILFLRLISVVTHVSAVSSFPAELHFVYPFSCWWRFGLFQLWAVRDTAVTICRQFFGWTSLHFCVRVELLGVQQMWVFW